MKYRVRLDLSFGNESEAQLLMNYARGKASKAVSINEGQSDEEISFCDYELCGHDESPPVPCTPLDRLEVRKL